MANDRVHIKCDGCGAWKMLLVHGAGLGTANNGILEWIDCHCGCHPRAFASDLGGVPGFSLYTDDAVGKELDSDRANALPPMNLKAEKTNLAERLMGLANPPTPATSDAVPADIPPGCKSP